MRINDLSKEIGKSNRELLSFLEKQGRKAAPMSNVTAEEANLIRDYFKPKNTEASRVDKSKTQQDGAERAEMQGEQPKKKKKFTIIKTAILYLKDCLITMKKFLLLTENAYG